MVEIFEMLSAHKNKQQKKEGKQNNNKQALILCITKRHKQ